MPLAIIGAGLPRTGTESLKYALEALGYRPCYHMLEVIEHPAHLPLWEAASAVECDWEALFAGYRAAVDFPAVYHWRRLVERYPAAKVILTVRDAEAWYVSLQATILTAVRQVPQHDAVTARRRALVRRDMVLGMFHDRADDREFMLGLFTRHLDAVKAAVAPDRLLVFDVRQGWASLCDFLQVATPAIDFPRGNATAEFRRKYLV